jgi:hypothetical protein
MEGNLKSICDGGIADAYDSDLVRSRITAVSILISGSPTTGQSNREKVEALCDRLQIPGKRNRRVQKDRGLDRGSPV